MGCNQVKPRSPKKTRYNVNLDVNSFVGEDIGDLQVSNEPIAKQYKFLELIGKGQFGAVRKVISYSNNKLYAVKSIPKERFQNSLYILQRELIIFRQLDHPNIIRFFETYQDDLNVYIVMEYFKGEEMFQVLQEKQYFSEMQVLQIMEQLFSAVCYIHFYNITHRDIKPENVLIIEQNNQYKIKLIDFGLSKTLQFTLGQDLGTKVGTPLYMAPEMINGAYGQECDNWSLGVLMYQLLCGEAPFYSESTQEIYEEIIKGYISFKEPQWETVSDDAIQLIKSLLNVDPKLRMTSHQALKHSWFAKNVVLKEQNLQKQTSDHQQTLKKLKAYADSPTFKKEALRIFVNHMQSKEIEDLHQHFKEFDLEQNGVITLQELIQIMKEYGYNDTEQEIEHFLGKFKPSQQEALQVLHINYSTFIAATLDTKRFLNKENLWVLFKELDIDNSNIITIENMRDVMQREGRKITNQELEQIMKNQQSPKIDFEVFCKIMATDD